MKLLHELRNPHNDFPSYFTELCARAANALEAREALTEADPRIQARDRAIVAMMEAGVHLRCCASRKNKARWDAAIALIPTKA